MKTLMAVFLLLAIAGSVLAFDGYDGDHAGQLPFCRNNKTGALKPALMKDIHPTREGVNYEPYCNTRPFYGTTIPTEDMIWINIQSGSEKSKKSGRRAVLTVDLSLSSFQRAMYIRPSPHYNTVSNGGG